MYHIGISFDILICSVFHILSDNSKSVFFLRVTNDQNLFHSVIYSLNHSVGYINSMPLNNSPEVFGLHSNAEIDYLSSVARSTWDNLVKLQPKDEKLAVSSSSCADSGNGPAGRALGSQDKFIEHVADKILNSLPTSFDPDRVRQTFSQKMTPTTIVLLQASHSAFIIHPF